MRSAANTSPRPILLATDGSPSAAHATEEAIELARAFGSRLVIVAVDHPVSPGTGFYGYSERLAELRAAEHRRTADTLRRACADATGAGVMSEPVHGGEGCVVVDEICRAARDRDARMIVVGARARTVLKRALDGSVSAAIVHRARCPVLVVP